MTSTFWPTTNSGATCTLPAELLQACASYEHFYNSRHSGRRLTWQPALGNADLRVAFSARSHDLNVSTFGTVILLLFESLPDDDFLSYEVLVFLSEIECGDANQFLRTSSQLQVFLTLTFSVTCNPLLVRNSRFLTNIPRRETFQQMIHSLLMPNLHHHFIK